MRAGGPSASRGGIVGCDHWCSFPCTDDLGRARACNLWFRRPTPYPLGHRAKCVTTSPYSTMPVTLGSEARAPRAWLGALVAGLHFQRHEPAARPPRPEGPPPGDPHSYCAFVLLGLSSPPLILDILRVAFSVRAERKDAAGTKRRFPQKTWEVSCGHFKATRASEILQTKVAKSAGRQAPVEHLGALSRLLWGSGPRAKQNTAKKRKSFHGFGQPCGISCSGSPS